MNNLITEILSIYQYLIDEEYFEKLLSGTTPLSKRLNLLLQVKNNDKNINTLNPQDKFDIYQALHDCITLVTASGTEQEAFEPLLITSIQNLGRKKELRQIFINDENRLMEWHFEKTIQSDIAKQCFGVSKDLRNDSRMKNKGKVCDYLISDNEINELVECKRVSPNKKPDNIILATAKKVFSYITDPKEQLKNTALTLDMVDASKHLIVDITRYCSKGLKKGQFPNLKYIGFSPEEIKSIINTIKRFTLSRKIKIDKVTLCWIELVFINGNPIAILHKSEIIHLTNNSGLYTFQGISVEGFPNKKGEMVSLRVSKKTSCHNRLADTYSNIYDPGSFGTSSGWTTIVPKKKGASEYKKNKPYT